MLLTQLFRTIVKRGELTVVDGNGRTRRYGDPGSGPRVAVRRHDRRQAVPGAGPEVARDRLAPDSG